ncbi:YnbE family lipoprotein [Mariprofundus erugo]|uniref:YnbE family lipoprotein n=2 Tax=Mariprofundus erugo TaxID=2528639 RepID=A0A5R9GMC3_9PROT|nr:YnbE family lipoprotein [Mariprofundus erugo]TLS74082.1 YnbE family lipoprotein [Mariprofundus erugo]
MRKHIIKTVMFTGVVASLMACAPTVKVEVPDKPITINLNVKIEHEIRVKVEKDLDHVLSQDSGLF